LLAEYGDEAKPLAGGQSLVPMLALRLARFDHLIDLNNIRGLAGVEQTSDGLRIGAMTRQATVGTNPLIANRTPLLAMATTHIGHFQIRNRGTIGGSLAHADPAAEYPAVAAALGARLEVASARGTRLIDAAAFFDGAFATALDGDELLVAARFPAWDGPSGFAFEEVARREGDFALVGAAVGIEMDAAGQIRRASVAMLGVGGAPVRATEAETALVGRRAEGGDLDEADLGRLAVAGSAPTDDIHASASYRRRVGAVVVARAVSEAARRAVDSSREGRHA
jgi:carbon-monoxide dehydrogenase medium subunit